MRVPVPVLSLLCGTIAIILLVGRPSHSKNLSFTSPALTRFSEPGGTEEDASRAATMSDEYAWDLFFYLNRQADQTDAGWPDRSKQTFREYDQDRSVIWESWALASGGDPNDPENNFSEVFLSPAKHPGVWGSRGAIEN